MKIILGSKSPRRQELLQLLDLTFTCETRDTDESFPPELQGGDIPQYIAKVKAEAFGPLPEDTLLITADTLVWMQEKGKTRVFGKPKDLTDARDMLRQLSGQTHQVTTGVCIVCKGAQTLFQVTTDVTFATLTEGQINYYVEKYRPLDKAGAYGIQEWIGAVGVKRLEGSYYNVMGLPVQRLSEELAKIL